MTTIQQLSNSFIQEAIASPILMNDLATMEMYIAESYTGRSLIELLQNADDAGATRFIVQAIDTSTFIAANDGRVFNSDDFTSLCRSGASTKKRKSNTIGFRGIGFKAVVNYAETVHVISGDYQFTFSRKKTVSLLPSDIRVPLERIPHIYSETLYENHIERLAQQGFKTIFIFETVSNKLEQEIQEFSSDCLLFLNHISVVEFVSSGRTQIIESIKTENEHGTLCCLNTKNAQTEWLVIKSENKSALAFKWVNGKTVPCSRDEAVAHSFLPTQEYLTIPMKVNGDFSTEPSRTRISCDEETMIAVSSCAEIITSLLGRMLHSGNDKIGLISILSTMNIDPVSNIRGLRINDVINERFLKAAHKSIVSHVERQGKTDIAIQPKWLSEADIRYISDNYDRLIVGNREESAMPGISLLLSRIGVKELDINSTLRACELNVMSSKTRINLLNTVANDTVFGLSRERIQLMQQAKLFDSAKGVFSFEESLPEVSFSDEFVEKILGVTDDSTKINYVLRKIGFSDKQVAPVMATKTPEPVVLGKDKQKKSFCKTVIRKWRSVGVVTKRRNAITSILFSRWCRCSNDRSRVGAIERIF